jgi:nucleotide-binding universal stress UspA family protein
MFKRILIPVDLDVEHSWTSTFPLAAGFARDWGASLHVLTVVPSFGMSLVGSYFPKGFENETLELAAKKLAEMVASSDLDPAITKTHVAHGSIYEEIINAADVLKADLILLTSHRPELKDYLLGPNAARVMRHASQSVFVVRK